MEISNIAQGQMVLHFNPLTMDKPRVWVKVEENGNTEPSLFIDNQALVRHCVHGDTPAPSERWLMGDKFYGEMVRKGEFVPITDLKEAEGIALEMGWPKYEVDIW